MKLSKHRKWLIALAVVILVFQVPRLWQPRPLWEFKSWRPFLAGWSHVTRPIFDGDKIYVCMGYGWWDNRVAVVALDRKTGKRLWKNDIRYASESFFESGDNLLVSFKNYHIDGERTKKLGPGKGIVWNHHLWVIDKKTGQTVRAIDEEVVPLRTDKWLYLVRPDGDLDRYDGARGLIDGRSVLHFEGIERFPLSAEEDRILIKASGQLLELADDTAAPSPAALAHFGLSESSDDFYCSFVVENDVRGSGRTSAIVCVDRATREEVFRGGGMQTSAFDLDGARLFYWPNGSTTVTYQVDLRTGKKDSVPFQSSVIAAQGDWLVSGIAHDVRVIDLRTGKVAWKCRTGGWVRSAAWKDGVLYVTDDSGALAAYEPKGLAR